MGYLGTPIDTRNTFQSLQGKRFNGDGSTTNFTLDVAPGSTLDIEVFVGNVRQDPNSAYTVSGTTLSFTGAPPSGTNNIYVVHQAKSVGTIDVPAGGVAADSLATSVLTGQTDIGADIADADLFLVDDGAGGTLRKTAASRLKTYAGFDVSSITGATALAVTPAATDEMIISDAGTLKRLDMTHMMTRPVFSATRNSSQTLNDDAITKIQYDVELVDSDSKYDNSTNYRFTPAVAGTYLIIHRAFCNKGSDSTINSMSAYIYKNGSSFGYSATNFAANPVRASNMTNTVIMDLDGDDYVEAYAHCNTTGGTVNLESSTAAPLSVFMGFKLATT